MRVLLATTQFAPELGGVPQLLWDFCAHRPADLDISVLSVRQREPSFYTEFDARAPFLIERIAPRGNQGSTSLEFARRLRVLIRTWQPDVIFSGVAYPTAIIVSAVTRITRTPFVVYAHSEDVTIPGRAKRMALAWALQRAATVMTVSDFTRRALVQMINPHRIALTPPGIDLTRFAPRAPLFESLTSKWVLLTAGRVIWRKGQDTVLRALPHVLAQVPNAHYLIVGDGPDTNALRALAAQLDVAEHVTFAGRVSDQDLTACFQQCDVFVMPTRPSDDASEVEGFGIVFLEASAASKPIVAGRAGGVADAVLDQVTGLLIDPMDVNAVADAVIRLAQDDVWRARLGQQGRARIEQEFTVEQFAGRVIKILRGAQR